MILLYSADQNICHQWKSELEKSYQVLEVPKSGSLSQQCVKHQPEIVILHINTTSGVEIVLGLLEAWEQFPEAKFIVFSDNPNDEEAIRLLRAGIHGYSPADVSPVLIEKTIKSVSSGEIWVGRKLMQTLICELGKFAQTDPSRIQAEVLEHLTAREREIALGVAGGETNKKIAFRYGITERTVKAHLGSVFQKTGTSDRLQLALLLSGQLIDK